MVSMIYSDWLIVFCKIDQLTLLNIKLINTLSVHFQEMPGFKGKRKRGLTLTLYKKPPRKWTKTSSSIPNLKSQSIRTPSLLKKSLSISKYLYPKFQTGFHIYSGATFLQKMTETSPQIYTSYNITWFQHIHMSNVNKHSLSASSHE